MRTALSVPGRPTVRVLDHQMHVDRQVGDFADALDDGLADGQIRHEMVVHHVHVNHVGIGDLFEVPLKIAEIRG